MSKAEKIKKLRDWMVFGGMIGLGDNYDMEANGLTKKKGITDSQVWDCAKAGSILMDHERRMRCIDSELDKVLDELEMPDEKIDRFKKLANFEAVK